MPVFLRRWRIRDALILAVLLGSATVLAVATYHIFQAATFGMETPPVVLQNRGLGDPEEFSEWANIFRWTTGDAQLALPNPGGTAWIDLQLASGARQAVLARLQRGNAAVALDVPTAPRTYSIILPPSVGERIRFEIYSSSIELNGRDLGVLVGDVRVAGDNVVPLQVLLALAVATVGGYVLLRQAGVRLPVAAGAIVALQVLAMWWQAAGGWRYAIFGPVLLLLGGASLLAVVLARWLPPFTRSAAAPIRVARVDVLVIVALVLVALCVRLPWLAARDPVGDLELAARRMGFLFNQGFGGAYVADGDYMPLRLYLLRGLSELVPRLGGSFMAPLPAPTLILIKLPGLIADLITLVLVYLWSRRWRAVRGAAAIAALYTLAPPVWINVAWWGQVDALLMLPLVASVIVFDRAGGVWSWLLWALALLIKPQAIILAPLVYAATLRRYGTWGVIRGGSLAIATIVVGSLPLIWAGQGPGLLQAYLGSVGRFPHLTNGAYNLWYLVSWGNTRVLGTGAGTLSFDQIGMALMGTAAMLVMWAVLRRADSAVRVEAATVLAFAFFTLPTQIHERYLFLPLVFLALCIAHSPRFVWLYLIVVVSATLNIVGTLNGFAPSVFRVIQGSPLPFALAVANLVVLLGLMVHLLGHSGVLQRISLAWPDVQQRSA